MHQTDKPAVKKIITTINVDYAVNSVPSAGSYTVTLRYYSSAAPVVGVQVNGGSSQTVNLANSYSWNIAWTTQTFNVTLNQGSNTIRIQGTGGGSCRQDRICVTGGGGGNPQPSGNCYELRLASLSQKRVTNVNGILKVKPLIGSGNTQTWKLIPDGSHFQIMAQDGTSRVLGVQSGGNSVGDIITLQTFSGQDHQLWSQELVTDSDQNPKYGFKRKNSSLIIHSEPAWGEGDPSDAVTDLKLTSGSDLNVFGRNKFFLDGKTCPTLRIGLQEESPETESNALMVSPNPNSGEFDVAFYLEKGKAATLSVTDMNGRTWHQQPIKGKGKHIEKIRLINNASGVFLVHLKKGKDQEVKKVVVVR